MAQRPRNEYSRHIWDAEWWGTVLVVLQQIEHVRIVLYDNIYKHTYNKQTAAACGAIAVIT
jgi:hypothetical protein